MNIPRDNEPEQDLEHEATHTHEPEPYNNEEAYQNELPENEGIDGELHDVMDGDDADHRNHDLEEDTYADYNCHF